MARKRVDWKRIRWGTLTRWCKRHEQEIKRKLHFKLHVLRG